MYIVRSVMMTEVMEDQRGLELTYLFEEESASDQSRNGYSVRNGAGKEVWVLHKQLYLPKTIWKRLSRFSKRSTNVRI